LMSCHPFDQRGFVPRKAIPSHGPDGLELLHLALLSRSALANAKRERRGLQRERLGLSYRPVRVKPHLQLVLTRCQVPREEAASIIPVVASTELERRRAQKALSWSHWVSPPLG